MSVRIIIDSTTDVSPAYQNRVRVVPLTIRFGDTELIDGVTVSRQRFYEMLVESDELPTTSQASPAAFEREYASAAQAGDSAVVLTISAQLSGTHQSACIAAQDFENVVVVDSQSATIGAGILAQYAVDCAERGMSAAEIAARLEEKRDDVCVIALLDTLEYLKRGGRISKTAAIAGGLLNLKPVASIENGRVTVIGKARGSRQGNNLLMQKIRDCGGVDFDLPLLLGYTGLSDALLRKYMEDSRAVWEGHADDLPQVQVGSVIGTHGGPGAVVAAFFRKGSRA